MKADKKKEDNHKNLLSNGKRGETQWCITELYNKSCSIQNP